MNESLKGRVALVTGGTGALGRRVVRRFALAGARVHLPSISGAGGEAVDPLLDGGGRGVTHHRCDVTSEDDVRDLFGAIDRKEGRLDILVNGVGAFAMKPIEETEVSIWEKMMDVNARSAFLCSRAAVPMMSKRRWGRIVNVASMPALDRGEAGLAAYAAAKAAVLNLTYSLSKELHGRGIAVNAILPSIIDTAANREAMPGADTSHWLDPGAIAQVLEFLASEEAGIVTGSALTLG